MNKRAKKILKISGISVGAVIALLLLVITIVINFVFTPAKLTPVVLRTANESLNAKLDMKSVELTFFSTFPRFGLKLTDGSLVSDAIRDTLWQPTDSLVSFKKCVVVVSPFDFLIDNKITLNYLGLEMRRFMPSVIRPVSPTGTLSNLILLRSRIPLRWTRIC